MFLSGAEKCSKNLFRLDEKLLALKQSRGIHIFARKHLPVCSIRWAAELLWITIPPPLKRGTRGGFSGWW